MRMILVVITAALLLVVAADKVAGGSPPSIEGECDKDASDRVGRDELVELLNGLKGPGFDGPPTAELFGKFIGARLATFETGLLRLCVLIFRWSAGPLDKAAADKKFLGVSNAVKKVKLTVLDNVRSALGWMFGEKRPSSLPYTGALKRLLVAYSAENDRGDAFLFYYEYLERTGYHHWIRARVSYLMADRPEVPLFSVVLNQFSRTFEFTNPLIVDQINEAFRHFVAGQREDR